MRERIQQFLRWLKQRFARSIHLADVPLLGSLRQLVFALMKTDQVRIDGHQMVLDPQDSLCLSAKGEFEPFESDLVVHEIRPGDVVLDLGANIGYYTLVMARKVGPKGRVYAFEPDPENFEILRKNVELNGYQNVTLINKAVSNKTGETSLFLSEENRGDHRLYDSADGRSSRSVATVRLDDFFQQGPETINFIKMDIQGSEFWALSGAKDLLRKSPGVILITEFWPAGLHRAGVEARTYLDLLSDVGFTCLEMKEDVREIRTLSPDRLLNDYPVAKEGFTTLLCTQTRPVSTYTQRFIAF